MKNHIRVEDKLLQTNKKYSSLKFKQKERIHSWMYESYKKKYQELKKYPDIKYDTEILEYVYEKIEEADIWIPYGEVAKHYKSVRSNLRKRLTRELCKNDPELQITLEILNPPFTVCKVSDYHEVGLDQSFTFIGNTDKEKSLVCPSDLVPDNATNREDGWKGFRIAGQLDFSLVGILAKIAKILASQGLSIFAISTFDTDYVFVKDENFEKAIKTLKGNHYRIIESEDSHSMDGGVAGAR